MEFDMKLKKGHKAVFAIFEHRPSMEAAITELKSRGFRNSDVSILMQGDGEGKKLGHELNSKAPEGSVTGASAGLIAGGALGWIAGIGALAIPGVGPLIAAGPIMAALAGAGIGGAIGGVTGGLIGMGIPEYEAKRFEHDVTDGGILLSVHIDDSKWADKAKDILKDAGARDISVANEADGKWDFQKEGMMPRGSSYDSRSSSNDSNFPI